MERGAAVMTEFVGRIRELVNKASIDKCRDIQLAVRVPQTIEAAMKVGFDIEAWYEKEYVDIVFVSTD